MVENDAENPNSFPNLYIEFALNFLNNLILHVHNCEATNANVHNFSN